MRARIAFSRDKKLGEYMAEENKTEIELRHKLSENPSKNYLFNLLYCHITAVNPERSLDAGIGELRNLWMFPGRYIGIGHRKSAYLKGLLRDPNPAIIRERGAPDVFLMRLENDFSFLGAFDLCVSTFTMDYVENRNDAIMRLSDRVEKDGSLILQANLNDSAELIRKIRRQYEYCDVTYCGIEEGVGYFGADEQEFARLTRHEMDAPNVPEGHTYFYLFATGKKSAAAAAGPVPEMIEDNGLRIVKSDMPKLLLTD